MLSAASEPVRLVREVEASLPLARIYALTGLPIPLPSRRHRAYTPAPSRTPHHPTPNTRTIPQSLPVTHVCPSGSSHLPRPASHPNTPPAASASAHIQEPPHIL